MGEGAASQATLERLRKWCASDRCTDGWIEIDQSRLDAFAEATGDRYWLHTEPQRAKHEGPFGNTIAHGFLLLSLVVGNDVVEITRMPGITLVLNYGLDRVRFLAPVMCGAKIRIRSTTDSLVENSPGRWLLRQTKTIEMQGQSSPVLIAEQLVLIVFD